MKEYTITRYSFDELSDESKEIAITNERQALSELDDSDMTAEVLAEQISLALTGNRETLIGSLKSRDWDLGYCQGDHVGIDGEIEVSDAPLIAWPTGAHSVKFTYHHYYGQQVNLYDSEGEDLDNDKALSEQLRIIERTVRRAGYAFLESLTTREIAINNLKEYEDIFLPNGKISIPLGISETVSI